MTAPLRRIVITGFMGAGKTSVAEALGELLGCGSIDLDEVITESAGRTPQQLIDQDGEAAFREVETRVLNETLADTSACVIALGGGAWTLERNRELVRAHGCITVWLDASFELCWHRIKRHVTEDRPNARNRDRARSLFAARRTAYQLADVRIDVTRGRRVDRIAADIHQAIERRERR
jgi:shikimate kinase